jgi:hypothetical protein
MFSGSHPLLTASCATSSATSTRWECLNGNTDRRDRHL